MLLTEYDEAFHIASEKEISLSEGIEIGRCEGIEIGEKRGMSRGIEIGKAEERKRTDIFKFKLKGYDEAAIAKQLELPIEQVRQALKEL